MIEQVPAPMVSNQVLDAVNIAPAAMIAVAVAQVENLLPTAAEDIAQNAAPEVTLQILIPSQFLVEFKLTCPFLNFFLAVVTSIWSSQLASPWLLWQK